MKEIFEYFPFYIKEMLEKEILNEDDFLEEIRIRVKNPIVLKFSKKEKIIRYLVTSEDILKILQLICENSIYSYQHQIAEGFVTIPGGHRVGISGSCVIENGKVYMKEANCPDRLCVHSKAIDEKGGSIVCLPNKVVLEVISNNRDIDTMT